jgi:hypothetical protein
MPQHEGRMIIIEVYRFKPKKIFGFILASLHIPLNSVFVFFAPPRLSGGMRCFITI